jgi:hypothetical protein
MMAWRARLGPHSEFDPEKQFENSLRSLQATHSIAEGIAHGTSQPYGFDPVRVALLVEKVRPLQGRDYCLVYTGGDAPGYFIYPFQGYKDFSSCF